MKLTDWLKLTKHVLYQEPGVVFYKKMSSSAWLRYQHIKECIQKAQLIICIFIDLIMYSWPDKYIHEVAGTS